MMLTELLVQDEGKTLEFKENCRPSQKILQTVVAFANTAGGTLVLGVRDRSKEVVGLSDPLNPTTILVRSIRASRCFYAGAKDMRRDFSSGST